MYLVISHYFGVAVGEEAPFSSGLGYHLVEYACSADVFAIDDVAAVGELGDAVVGDDADLVAAAVFGEDYLVLYA